MRLTPYGIREILIAFVVLGAVAGGCVAAAHTLSPWLGYATILPGVVFLWVLSFFRDPERTVPAGPSLLVSPADGTVTHIDEVEEPSFINGKAHRISIFMSIFNVHVNRAPCDGRVAYKQYRKGEFLNAMSVDSTHRNEANDMGLETGDVRVPRVLVRQIAGLIARRIVCDREVGAELKRGERFGMIKFSSRVEVYVPATSGLQVKVQIGDAVKAGATILGELP